jgi:hypothetical protein
MNSLQRRLNRFEHWSPEIVNLLFMEAVGLLGRISVHNKVIDNTRKHKRTQTHTQRAIRTRDHRSTAPTTVPGPAKNHCPTIT